MGHHKERNLKHNDYKVGKQPDPQEEAKAKLVMEVEAQPESEPKQNDEELDGIRAQQERLIRRLSDLREASHDAWDELKSGTEGAFDELRTSVQKVIARFETALKQEHKQ